MRVVGGDDPTTLAMGDAYAVSNPTISETFESTDGKIGLDFQVNDEILLYGSVSTGVPSPADSKRCVSATICARARLMIHKKSSTTKSA